MVVLLAYFSGREILDDPMMLMCMFFVVLIALFYIKKPAWALAFLITLGIDVFGAISLPDLPSISLGGLGSFLVHDIILLLFLGLMFFASFRTRSILTGYSISHPLMAFILLTVLEGFLTFLNGANLHLVLQYMRPYAYYLLYFMILSSIKSKDELIQFMKLIVIIAIISAGVTYYQAITGELKATCFLGYHPEYGLYQSLNAGGVAMVCVFLSLFSLLIGKKMGIKYFLLTKLILLWVGGAILFMLIRGVWLSIFLAIVIIVVFSRSQSMKLVVVLLLMFVFFVVGFSVIERHFGTSKLSYIITHRLGTMGESFSRRGSIMMGSRLNYLIDNPSLFGYGFKQKYKGDRFDPTIVTGHSLLGDLAARYGFSGFLVFGWLLFAVFRQAIHLLRTLPNSWQQSIVLGLLAFNIQTFIYSYSANTYFGTWGIVIIASSWAVLELIERFHEPGEKQSLTFVESR